LESAELDSLEYNIRENGAGLEVSLHVQPRARHTRLAGTYGGRLKVSVTAPPVDQAANRAIVEFFSHLLDLPKSRLRIISGESSREKVLRIEGMSRAGFHERISAPS